MKRRWSRFLSMLLALALLPGACALAEEDVSLLDGQTYDNLVTPKDDEKDDPSMFFTILLLGIDEEGLQGEGETTAGRADAIIIATLSSEGDIRMASVERDLCVTLPEEYGTAAGYTKLCITPYFGGLATTLAMVNDVLKLGIPYYAAIDKAGVVEMINAIGGLEIEITEEDLAVDEVRKHFRSLGTRKLNGRGILSYIGERTMDNTGDADRNRRQRKVLTAVYQKCMSMGMEKLTSVLTKSLSVIQTNMGLMGILSIMQTAMGASFTSPEEMRFPQNYKREVRNLHNVVVANNMEAEIEALHAFLY